MCALLGVGSGRTAHEEKGEGGVKREEISCRQLMSSLAGTREKAVRCSRQKDLQDYESVGHHMLKCKKKKRERGELRTCPVGSRNSPKNAKGGLRARSVKNAKQERRKGVRKKKFRRGKGTDTVNGSHDDYQ